MDLVKVSSSAARPRGGWEEILSSRISHILSQHHESIWLVRKCRWLVYFFAIALKANSSKSKNRLPFAPYEFSPPQICHPLCLDHCYMGRLQWRREVESPFKNFAFTFSTFFPILLFLLCSQKKQLQVWKKQREKKRENSKTPFRQMLLKCPANFQQQCFAKSVPRVVM